MDDNQKETNHFLGFLIFLVVVICTTLILLDIYANVASELRGALLTLFA